MLSNACKYAIRALLYLGINSEENSKLGVRKIAGELEIPQPFLAQLLRNLSNRNLVSSTKGPGGGFYLSEENLQNSVWDVISFIDGEIKFEECFLGLSKCNDVHPCPAHSLVSPFKKELFKDFKEKTIADYLGDIRKNGTVLSLKYVGV